METIIIDELDRKTIIDIDKEKRMGNTFYQDGRIEPITNDVLSVFKAFLLSNNRQELPNEGKYKVILDKNTGFKHYFLNGEESFIMFFLNNGEDGRICKVENKGLTDNGWRKEEKLSVKEKIFRVGNKIIHCTCEGLLIILLSLFLTNSLMVVDNPKIVNDFGPFPFVSYLTGSIKKQYTVDELIERIYASDVLSDEDQIYLANKEFFEDIVPYVNESNDAIYSYSKKFNNIHVEVVPPNDHWSGYYKETKANCLHITSNYNTDKYYDNIITHEFIHLCQNGKRYNVLVEATAEILSYEYYDGAELTSYSDEVFLTRKLMEIIGPEPILHYVIGNNFSYIENAIKPYLTEREYKIFLDDLYRPNSYEASYDKEKVKEKFESLKFLLDKVYENKFGKKVDEDPVIPYLRNKYLSRYYFNHRKINKEWSYIIIPITIDRHMTLEEAFNEGYVYITQIDDEGNEKKISYQDYMDSNYDWNKNLNFYLPKPEPTEIYLGEDDRLHVMVTKIVGGPKTVLPTIEEKLNELEGKVK